MTLTLYQVDAFTNRLFHGNPAAVVPLKFWLDDDVMQRIAAENNLAETAFFVRDGDEFDIRWFTPSKEVELCGHATLASAHVLFCHEKHPSKRCTFKTRHRGKLTVERTAEYLIMDFPVDPPQKVAGETELKLSQTLDLSIRDIRRGLDDFLVVVDNPEIIIEYQPDFRKIAELDARGLIISSATDTKYDFVSRCFFPRFGIDEDPVTGSAHTLLTPYWSEQLGKKTLMAKQASHRTGEITCEMKDNRVLLGGKAITYLIGEIYVE
ncbi:MAG: PhzF family phenazine biosynthesis protein [Saprospiraceae bacterium]|nr:PhzF family phenazine biosynthesis protein [Saprospiraceae bacterium]